jgi:AraC-like DNA-binding protein
MALSISVDRVDETGRELLTYGTEDFPIAFFDDDLTKISVPYHWHDELEIVIITNGAVRMRIAGTELTLKTGDGYFSNSGILHAETLVTLTGHQHALVFSPRIISQREDLIWKTYLSPVIGNPQIPFLLLKASVPWQKEILRLAETAWIQGAYEEKDYPLSVRSSLSMAFSHIVDHLKDMENETHYTSAFQRDELRIKKILIYIERNYGANITLEELANSANISASTCLRLFSTVLGTTPIKYLLTFRLQRAAEALKCANGRTVSEIAHSCGFSDASYFNRCFRKEYGITPTEYCS